MREHLQATLDAAVAAGIPGIVAAVTIDGEPVFEGTSGVRSLGGAAPMTSDTVLAIYSMTKAVTGVAAMQLVERGEVDLDEPVARVLPLVSDVQVLDGFDDDAQPVLRAPRTPLTLRHLLTHTSGYVYDAWDADMTQYLAATDSPPFGTFSLAAMRVPLMFDPGSRWEYGIGIDLAGLMVEAITGMTLGAYLQANVFEPLGMLDTAFTPTPSMAQRQASLHATLPDVVVPFEMPQPSKPEFESGGGGLYSTVPDYLRFANAILNGGTLHGTQILHAQTVADMSRNSIGELSVVPLLSYRPEMSCDVDFFPDARSTWGLSFLRNETDTPQGRPAGSLAWAGLANSYFWIDPVHRVCGVWASQILPFFTPPAIEGFRSFETAFYRSLRG